MKELTADTKIKLSQIKDLADWHQQLVQDKHSGARIGDIHRWADGSDHIKTAHGWKPVTKEEDRKRANAQVVNSWATKENYKWAREKTKNDIISRHGNTPEAIGIIPSRIKAIFKDVNDDTLYCGKGYFIDHMANHHPEVPVELYKKIQSKLENAQILFHDPKNNSLVLSNEIAPKEKELLILGKEPNSKKIVLYKSLYIRESNNYPKKYKIISPGIFPGLKTEI